MEDTNPITDIRSAVVAIKGAIQHTRYAVARQANRQALALYYGVGGYLSQQIEKAQWGDGVLAAISNQLQQELPGLKGFSKTNIKRMLLFYKGWSPVFGPLPANRIEGNTLFLGQSTLSADIKLSIIGPKASDQFDKIFLSEFLSVNFSQHYELLVGTKTLGERSFYIHRIATEFWTLEKLRYNLRANLYASEGTMPNNFAQTISNETLRRHAEKAFRSNYDLDFLHIADPDDWDEERVEHEMVHHIRKTIMALGAGFTFMGRQYRLVVDEQEYFIDLLFYHRRLRSLVAIELKWTEFRPEYVGKMNFYLSALDDTVRLPDENPSIGVILCRGQKTRTVEYALRDTRKPMGVATYRSADELPEQYRDTLAALDELKHLL